MKVVATDHPEVLLVEPAVFHDTRGLFKEMFHAEKYQASGLPGAFVQDNLSRSTQGVLRGLHYQLNQPQGKLVSVVAGEVLDVAVDIRKGSPHFGQWVGVVLSGDNHRQLYIPPGFAHGFCVISESADFLYKCTDFYAPGDEYGIIWNDPDVGIEWPQMDFLLSGSDSTLPRLCDSEYLPAYQPVDR
jgi:dTDP-4-dehydrorhamnose 3,5-epimerase